MGYVPTHGPDCFKIQSFFTYCRTCQAAVVYFECSCGSKILLDPPDDGFHECGQFIRAERASLLIDLIYHSESEKLGQTQCPMCNIILRNDRAKRHFKKCPKRKEWFPL